MYKDPTEFRARFKAYKEGKMPYENGLPRYAPGKIPETVDDATLDFIINHEGFKPNAWVKDPVTGKMLLGSGIDVNKYKELFRKTGKWSAEDNRRAVRDIVIGNRPTIRRIFGDKYNSLTPAQKGVIDDIAFNIGAGALANSSPKFVAAVLSGNMEEAKRQMDWGNHLARGLVNRNKDRLTWWDSMSLTPVEVPAYIARPQQQQLPPVVPELKPYLFPYETQQLIKPLSLFNPTIMSRPSSRRLPNDLLWSLVFDDEPKQDDGLLYAKNGKLPEYEDGLISIIKKDPSSKKAEEWADNWKERLEMQDVIFPKRPVYQEERFRDKMGNMHHTKKLAEESDENTKFNRALYNLIDPAGGIPTLGGAALMYAKAKLKANFGDPDKWEREPLSTALGDIAADEGWKKYLGYNYDKSVLRHFNGDTVRLHPDLEKEIPTDTTMLINRIKNNKALLKKWFPAEQKRLLKEAYDSDIRALNALHKTYETGMPTGLDEYSYNNRNWFDGQYINPQDFAPLNILHLYNIRVDKPTNRQYYSDTWDLDGFDWALPGKPFPIRGYVDLPSYSNGKIYIKPANRGKLTRLKARTGKSESELYNDGNPAHKKMVVFARNARKWKH